MFGFFGVLGVVGCLGFGGVTKKVDVNTSYCSGTVPDNPNSSF